MTRQTDTDIKINTETQAHKQTQICTDKHKRTQTHIDTCTHRNSPNKRVVNR